MARRFVVGRWLLRMARGRGWRLMNAIRLRGVRRGFGDGARYRPVIDGLDLEVAAGGTVALCGPSGSGKSTLLNLMAGLLPVDAGTLTLRHDGRSHDLSRLAEAERTALRRRAIGYVFQFFNLVPTLTVLENVALPLALNRLERRLPEVQRRLAALGLSERLDAYPAALSGGEQQRVAIARALAHEPSIVLADEPTGNLDARRSEQVADALFAESRRLGSALVVATHSVAVAERADRIVELGP